MLGHTRAAGEHCLALDGDVALAWVPGDVLVAVVLELVLAGPGAQQLSLSQALGVLLCFCCLAVSDTCSVANNMLLPLQKLWTAVQAVAAGQAAWCWRGARCAPSAV